MLSNLSEYTVLSLTLALLLARVGRSVSPNTTTFILPSLVFSPECRTTLNGISAAAGKLGALTGATLFEPVAASVGDVCAFIALLSFILTWWFVQMHPTTANHHPHGTHS